MSDKAIDILAATFRDINSKAGGNMGAGGARACAILATVFASGGVNPNRLEYIEVGWEARLQNVFPNIKIKFFGKDEPWEPSKDELNLPE